MRVLVVNAGSSTLKLSLLDHDDSSLAARELDAPEAGFDAPQVETTLTQLGAADAVGHRIVHGGSRFAAVRVDDALVGELRELEDLAPLHQARALAAMQIVARARPDLPAVACFDTAFHHTLPAGAATYALPRAWRERHGLRRFGFHGLSHGYAAGRAAALLGRPATGLRLVTCHLGAGASLAAVRDGASVDTTMGFTPLEGLVMATRSGTIDPGLILWLLQRGELSLDELADGLEHRSGLLGLAGSSDMRELLARDDDDAALALDVYLHRLRAGIAAMAAALGGLDALVFTGGVGEHSAAIRTRATAPLGFLGVALDATLNEGASGDADISASGASARVLVIAAREDLEIARQVRATLGAS